MTIAKGLLDEAKAPLQGSSRGRPRQAKLRRCVSTAYYAVFHALIDLTLREVVGHANSRRAIGLRLRRTISHKTIADVAKSFASDKQPDYLVELRGARAWPPGPDVVRLCTSVVELQRSRHDADYNFSINFDVQEVKRLVALADESLRILNASASHPDLGVFAWSVMLGDAIRKNSPVQR
jgi:hypothetical protein